MTSVFACVVYALTMVLANAIVGHFGPWVSPINAFMLIGFELTLRDWLHERLTRLGMLGLILVSALLTWALNAAPARIAIASAAAFAAAASVDWLVYALLRKRRWLVRSNASNVASAAVDSVIFPTLAFGLFMPHIVALQFAAKVAGSFLWSLALKRRMDAHHAQGF